MNRLTFTAALAAILFSVAPIYTHAADADKSAQAQQPNIAEFDKQMAQAQENMKKMQEQMDKLQQTQDPKEREKLLQAHWTLMQGNMSMMGDMWGPGMMGCCGGGNHMGGHMMGGHMMGWQETGAYYSKLTPDQMKQRQYMMDRYTNMQQMMMNHMMWHQNYMWPQQTK